MFRALRGTLFSCALWALGVSGATAAELARTQPASAQKDAASEPIEFWAAERAGNLRVQFIPKDDTQGRLLLTNPHHDRPLHVRLPDVIAASPALAQFFDPAAQRGGRPLGQKAAGRQRVGMGVNPANGFPPFGNGPNGLQQRNGIFSIPPEKQVTLRLSTVCLDHGKAKPRPAIAYQLQPLEDVCSQAELREALKLLAAGKLEQRACQAIAWHVVNGMSWESLAAERIEHVNGTSDRYFAEREVAAAKRTHDEIVQRLKARPAAPRTSLALQ